MLPVHAVSSRAQNVGGTSIATQQVVEMSIELGRSIDGNVLVFINDHILRNDGTANRGAATAAIDVDSGGPVRGRVVRVGAVSGDEVANDHVPIHVIRRSTKGRADMGVKRNARNTVTRQFVSDDHVTRDAAGALAIGKKAHSRATNLHAVLGRNVFGDGTVSTP